MGDIRDYSASEIRKAAGLTAQQEIDLIVAPPCRKTTSPTPPIRPSEPERRLIQNPKGPSRVNQGTGQGIC
jgi:hypothetical protein